MATTASGLATFHLVGNELFWKLGYTNLTGAAQAAHIHGPATASENAPRLVTIPISASISGTAEGSATLSPATLNALVDGKSYVNIHTPQHGAGEIRGQIAPASP